MLCPCQSCRVGREALDRCAREALAQCSKDFYAIREQEVAAEWEESTAADRYLWRALWAEDAAGVAVNDSRFGA